MQETSPDQPLSAPLRDRCVRFLLGLTAIMLFAFVVVPLIQRLGPVAEVRDAIRNREIDATALFYTESDISSEAEGAIRNAMKYPVR